MIDHIKYKTMLRARVAEMKALQDEKDAMLTSAKGQLETQSVEIASLRGLYDEMEADIKAVLAPLNTVKNLLPAKVKEFIAKYTG